MLLQCLTVLAELVALALEFFLGGHGVAVYLTYDVLAHFRQAQNRSRLTTRIFGIGCSSTRRGRLGLGHCGTRKQRCSYGKCPGGDSPTGKDRVIFHGFKVLFQH